LGFDIVLCNSKHGLNSKPAYFPSYGVDQINFKKQIKKILMKKQSKRIDLNVTRIADNNVVCFFKKKNSR
jgi:hypothetical protein